MTNTSSSERQVKCQGKYDTIARLFQQIIMYLTLADVDECKNSASNNCLAPAKCTNVIGGYNCVCPTGYEIKDKFSCIDIDECSIMTHSCAQICSNIDGQYSCSCHDGYTLAQDKTNCTLNSLQEAECTNLGCSHICNFTTNTCDCPQGYQLDGKECKSKSFILLKRMIDFFYYVRY